jgi:murein DD-endopeptidase MepM/ murein hydrolase activator NlpD
MVKIQHNSVYATAYLHLSGFGEGISPGVFVRQGQIIGYVGSSGLSTGPHLDFRFYRNGSPIDPLKVDAPPVEPVSEDNRARFEKNKTVILSLLGTFN